MLFPGDDDIVDAVTGSNIIILRYIHDSRLCTDSPSDHKEDYNVAQPWLQICHLRHVLFVHM